MPVATRVRQPRLKLKTFARALLELSQQPVPDEKAHQVDFVLKLDELVKDAVRFVDDQLTPCAKECGINTEFHATGFLFSIFAAKNISVYPMTSEDNPVRRAAKVFKVSLESLCERIVDTRVSMLKDIREGIVVDFIRCLDAFWDQYQIFNRKAVLEILNFFGDLSRLPYEELTRRLDDIGRDATVQMNYCSGWLYESVKGESSRLKLDLDWAGLDHTEIFRSFIVNCPDIPQRNAMECNPQVKAAGRAMQLALKDFAEKFEADPSVVNFNDLPTPVVKHFIEIYNQWLSIVTNHIHLINAINTMVEIEKSLNSDDPHDPYSDMSIAEKRLAIEACQVDIRKLAGDDALDDYYSRRSNAHTPTGGSEDEGDVLATQSDVEEPDNDWEPIQFYMDGF